MITRIAFLITLVIPLVSLASTYRGNLNLSYHAVESGSQAPPISNFGQVLNFYLDGRVFYSNDLTLSALVFHNKVSNRERGDFRVRYAMNLTGYRYNSYLSYSPYTLYRPLGPSEKIRVLQGSLTCNPKLLPDISASYTSTRQFTSDQPHPRSGLSYSWNIGTLFSKSFGTFRGIYQKQRGRIDAPIPQKQTTQTLNLGYDVARELPLKISGSASYSFTGTRVIVPGDQDNDTRTHLGALQASKPFGRALSLSISSSGRRSQFERGAGRSRIQDFSANASAALRIRENLSLVFLRGYNSNETGDNASIKIVNDYLNIGGGFTFPLAGDGEGRLSLSRALYFQSALGRTTVDNAGLLLDVELYRQTGATVNLGLAHNDRTYVGVGRYQMTRTIGVSSRPRRNITVNISYQSSLASNRVNFVDANSDNFSANLTHTPRAYFNYSVTYTLSTFKTTARNVYSTLTVAANYRLARSLSALTSYTRRDLAAGLGVGEGEVDESISNRLSWLVARRMSITLNYTVANLNSSLQGQSYGGYLDMTF